MRRRWMTHTTEASGITTAAGQYEKLSNGMTRISSSARDKAVTKRNKSRIMIQWLSFEAAPRH